ncbi:MAG: XdhC family protein [Acidobacteria bacterium]|nr:XdhC family protein [Acidobacteriota bacterium]
MVDIYEEIVRLRKSGEPAALVSLIGAKGSLPRKDAAKMLVRRDGSFVGSIGGGCTEAEAWQHARKVIESGEATALTFHLTQDDAAESGLLCGGTMEVYIEPIYPDPVLYIFGAGHIAQPLCKIASMVGFQVVVADDRPMFANRDRFPDAHEILAENDFEEIFPKVKVNEYSYIVIVTRGHRHDLTVLRWAVQTDARYIGLVGSKRKIAILFKEVEQAGIQVERMDRIYTPIGLEIGSETPEEIAVSVAAELIALRKAVDVSSLTKSRVREMIEKVREKSLAK